MKEFLEYFNDTDDSGLAYESGILAYLTRMRHLTGIAKIDTVVEFVEDFIAETERKICIFVHHKDVAQSLLSKLQALQAEDNSFGKTILSLTSDLNGEARNSVVENFWEDENRILIASTLASGEGLNLQCGADCVMMERQWNPAKEEQAEARFTRIGRPEALIAEMGDKVNAMYPVATGTVDEFFAEIVERKRSICANTLDGEKYNWQEGSLMKELAENIALKGGKKWGF